MRRSLNRGLGPPQRAVGLPISLLKKETEELLGFAGIRHPRASYITAEGWMSREIEVANARMAAVSVIEGDEEDLGIWSDEDLVVELALPVSKADTYGRGKPRRLRCSCRATSFSQCAARVLLEHI